MQYVSIRGSAVRQSTPLLGLAALVISLAVETGLLVLPRFCLYAMAGLPLVISLTMIMMGAGLGAAGLLQPRHRTLSAWGLAANLALFGVVCFAIL